MALFSSRKKQVGELTEENTQLQSELDKLQRAHEDLKQTSEGLHFILTQLHNRYGIEVPDGADPEAIAKLVEQLHKKIEGEVGGAKEDAKKAREELEEYKKDKQLIVRLGEERQDEMSRAYDQAHEENKIAEKLWLQEGKLVDFIIEAKNKFYTSIDAMQSFIDENRWLRCDLRRLAISDDVDLTRLKRDFKAYKENLPSDQGDLFNEVSRNIQKYIVRLISTYHQFYLLQKLCVNSETRLMKHIRVTDHYVADMVDKIKHEKITRPLVEHEYRELIETYKKGITSQEQAEAINHEVAKIIVNILDSLKVLVHTKLDLEKTNSIFNGYEHYHKKIEGGIEEAYKVILKRCMESEKLMARLLSEHLVAMSAVLRSLQKYLENDAELRTTLRDYLDKHTQT